MADTRFVVKHGLVVNGSFTANGSAVNAASISATALSIGVVSVNATTINVGTVTVNSTTFSGTSNNSTNLGGQPASFYTNASNMSSGTIPADRLSGTYSLTANNSLFLGGVAAASYQTTAGLAANVATLTANNSNNLNGQSASYYTDIPSRLGYTPVSRAGDTLMVGNYSTNGTSISVGRGEAGEKILQLFNVNRQVYWYLTADGSQAGLFDATVGIGNGIRIYTDISKNFYAFGNITAYASDARLKTNVRNVSSSPLEDVKKISGYRFEWREDGPQPMRGTDVGLLAQEVEKVIPEAVADAPFDGEYKTLKMNQQVTALLVEAIKELASKVEALERKIDTL